MKRIFSGNRIGLKHAVMALSFVLLLAACSKFDNDDNNSGTPVSGLMAFNLVPDKDAIGISLNGNNLTPTPLNYTSFTGTYQRVFAGNRQIESYEINSDSTLATSAFAFEPDKFYSLFVTGANGEYRNIIVRDNVDSLSAESGKAYLRYINAIPDSTKPTVTITAGGGEIFNSEAGYSTVSEFAEANPGQVSIAVKNNSTINADRTISLEQGKVYTILLLGLPEAGDTTHKVQIRYIENGSLSPNQ